MADDLYLRRARVDDAAALNALFAMPDVYHYLADGAPPPRSATAAWLDASAHDFATRGFGLWLLFTAANELVGCVRVATPIAADLADPLTAELTYVVHPHHWRRKLATRMSVTVLTIAFEEGQMTRIVAGADAPNHASIAVMQRLGMTFLRHATYPAGPGVEYFIDRDRFARAALPARYTPIPVRSDIC
jgi:ribosomal-protein-alanine N-acetyltransferase